MKSALLLAVLGTLFSCGRIDNVGTSNIGRIRAATSEPLTENDVMKVKQICDSLLKKQTSLSAAANGNYTFEVSSKGCESDTFSKGTDVVVSIETTDTAFKFRRVDGNGTFVFPDVETPTSGVMKDICAGLSSKTVPVVTDAGLAIWFSPSVFEDCRPGSNEHCLLIEKGVPKVESYEIVSKEWMIFQVDRTKPNYGFYTQRRLQSNSSCPALKYIETRANLK